MWLYNSEIAKCRLDNRSRWHYCLMLLVLLNLHHVVVTMVCFQVSIHLLSCLFTILSIKAQIYILYVMYLK